MRELTVGELRFIDESTNDWRMYIYSKVDAKVAAELQERLRALSDEYKAAFLDFYKKRVEKETYVDAIETKNEFDKFYEKRNPAFYDINGLIGRDVRLAAEVLGAEEMNVCISYMDNEEVQGILNDRLTGIGVYDETDGILEGFGIVEIFPEYILIRRVDTCLDVREEAILESVGSYISQTTKENKLPIYLLDMGGGKKTSLQGTGFALDKKKFMCELGMSSNLKKIVLEKKNDMSVTFLEEVEEEEVLPFLLNAPYDSFFQIPYADIKADHLSGSIICKNKDRILAMILIEDDDRYIKIPWYYYKDKAAMDACFLVLKNILKNDFESDMPILFLDSGKNKKELMDYFSGKIKEVPLCVYRWTGEAT